MRSLLVIAAVAAAAAVVAAGAVAVVNGVPDGNGHPNVGELLAQQAFPDGTFSQCTGTLIAPKVFLTAEHCDEGVSRVSVTFEPTYVPGKSKTYSGTWVADPNYNKSFGDAQDLAVVLLDRAPVGITPAGLPTLGEFDWLGNGAVLTSVGYGAQSVTSDKGGHTLHFQDTRFVTTGTVSSLPSTGCTRRRTRSRATAAAATATRGGRSSPGSAAWRSTSWSRPTSPATRIAARPTSAIASTRRRRAPSSEVSRPCRKPLQSQVVSTPTTSRTASADFPSASRSASSRSTSRICSMPERPSFTGTPM